MKQTSSRDTQAYKQGDRAFRKETTRDCGYEYGTEQYNDWWQGYDDALREHMDNVLGVGQCQSTSG